LAIEQVLHNRRSSGHTTGLCAELSCLFLFSIDPRHHTVCREQHPRRSVIRNHFAKGELV
jgi:hypothetical protein